MVLFLHPKCAKAHLQASVKSKIHPRHPLKRDEMGVGEGREESG